MRRTRFVMSASPKPIVVAPAPHFVHVHRMAKDGEVLTYSEQAGQHKRERTVVTSQERRDNAPVATAPNGWSTYSGATLAQRAVR